MTPRPSSRSRFPAALAAALALAFVLALAGAPGAARAQEPPLGELTLERGLVKIRRAEREQVYQQKGLRVPIFRTDVLHTGKATRAVLKFTETGEVVTIYADTHVAVSDLRREKGLFVLNAGKALFALLRDLAQSREVLVRTRTATFGVKGTQFVVGAKEEESFALTLEGTVAATTTAAPEKEILIQPGQMYFATAEEAPPAPIEVPPEQRRQIVNEDSLRGMRSAAGLPEEGAGTKAPPSIFLHAGLADQNLRVPFKDGGDHYVKLSGGGLLLSVEWRVIGPFIVEGLAIAGGLDEATSDQPGMSSKTVDGDMTTVAALAGLRGDFFGSFTAALGVGPFRHWTVIKDSGGGNDTRVNLDGWAVRGELDYVLKSGISFGIGYLAGSGKVTGNGPDDLRAQGFTVDKGEFTSLSLSVGGRF